MQIALSFSFVLIFFFNHPATTVIYTLSLHDALPIWDSLQIPVLEDIKLEIGKGDFVALMGPSGSGKTTLLNLIAGIDTPTAGRIIIDGRDISSMKESGLARWRSDHIGFIFQLCNLIPALTAFENVELPLLLPKLSRK